MRPEGGAQRAIATDTTKPREAVERVAQTSDNTQRTKRPGANVIANISIVAGTPTYVNHGCGSARVRWVVCDMRSATGSMVWRTTLDDRQLVLNASANCEVAIEVWSE